MKGYMIILEVVLLAAIFTIQVVIYTAWTRRNKIRKGSKREWVVTMALPLIMAAAGNSTGPILI